MVRKREMILELGSSRMRPALPQAPVASSAAISWSGCLVEHHSIPSFENNHVACLNNIAVLHLGAPFTLEWKRDGRFRQTRMKPGDISVVPADLPHSARSTSQCEFVMVSLNPRLLACAAGEAFSLDRLELVWLKGVRDSLVQGVALALKAEVEAGGLGGRIYGETLASTLAVHLVRKYSACEPVARESQCGLGRHQLRRAIEFIQDQLKADVSLSAIAAAAGMSQFHFARKFKESTGLAPHQYVIRCRLDRARQMLLASPARISDAALEFGFCDQSHFTFHFKRVYGVTPRAFLRSTIPSKNVP